MSDATKMLSSKDVTDREPEGLWVPYRTINEEEGITLGFRQEMISLEPEDKNDPSGSVTCGAGLGTDFIIFSIEHEEDRRMAVMRGSELMKRWVRSFDPELAERIPAEFG